MNVTNTMRCHNAPSRAVVLALLVTILVGAVIALTFLAGPAEMRRLPTLLKGDWDDTFVAFSYRPMVFQGSPLVVHNGDRVWIQISTVKNTGGIAVTYESPGPFIINDTSSVQPKADGNYFLSRLYPGTNGIFEDEVRAQGDVKVSLTLPEEGARVGIAVNSNANQTLLDVSDVVNVSVDWQGITARGENFEKKFLLPAATLRDIKNAIATAPKNVPLRIAFIGNDLKSVYSFYGVLWAAQ